MAGVSASAKARETSIEITIIRADGSTEPLGVVSYWHRNPFKRWVWRFKKLFGFHK